jgi:hypothetical protein
MSATMYPHARGRAGSLPRTHLVVGLTKSVLDRGHGVVGGRGGDRRGCGGLGDGGDVVGVRRRVEVDREVVEAVVCGSERRERREQRERRERRDRGEMKWQKREPPTRCERRHGEWVRG